jgi:hypothetical protein
VFIALQTRKPTGRDLVGHIAPFLSNAPIALLNLSQRESPLLANSAQSRTNACHKRTFVRPESGKTTQKESLFSLQVLGYRLSYERGQSSDISNPGRFTSVNHRDSRRILRVAGGAK